MAGKNLEVARVFDEIADLLELTGQNKFRVNAYHNAARSLRDVTDDLVEIATQDSLKDIPNIGASMADHIKEYLDTGHVGRLDELARQVPQTLVALLQIPGLGPKKIMAVHENLGVKSMDDLKRVVDSGQLAKLPGMGQKTADRIRQGMAFLEQASQRVPLGAARPIALDLIERIREFPEVQQVESAGSMRRGKESVGDVDILCVAPAGSDAVERFTNLPHGRSHPGGGRYQGFDRGANPRRTGSAGGPAGRAS